MGFYFHPTFGPHEGDPIGGDESSVLSPEEFATINAQWHSESPISLQDARDQKRTEIRDGAERFLQSMAVEYGAMEKLTWDQQAIEAEALGSDTAAQAPLVRSIAAGRGMAVLELAARISTNHANWAALSGYIVGQRLAYQDALDAATTVSQVEAIVPVYELP